MQTEMRPLNAALIGLGMVAETHLRAIQGTDGRVVLRGVLGRSAGTRDRFLAICDQLGATPKAYTGLDELLADDALDMVILATPPNARKGFVTAFARARLPVLMEKPVERNLANARELVEICEQARLPLGIVFQHRMRDAARHLIGLMDAQALGALRMVDVRVPWWREQSYYDVPGRGSYRRDGGGVLISQAIHTLDLMLRMTGPVQTVSAMMATTGFHTMEAEDMASAGLQFANGATGAIMATTAAFPGGGESITLHCEKASAELSSAQLTLQWRDGRVEQVGEAGGTGGGADPMAFSHAWHQGILENFADVIQSDAPLVASGREALGVHALIEGIEQSARSGKHIRMEHET